MLLVSSEVMMLGICAVHFRLELTAETQSLWLKQCCSGPRDPISSHSDAANKDHRKPEGPGICASLFLLPNCWRRLWILANQCSLQCDGQQARTGKRWKNFWRILNYSRKCRPIYRFTVCYLEHSLSTLVDHATRADWSNHSDCTEYGRLLGFIHFMVRGCSRVSCLCGSCGCCTIHWKLHYLFALPHGSHLLRWLVSSTRPGGHRCVQPGDQFDWSSTESTSWVRCIDLFDFHLVLHLCHVCTLWPYCLVEYHVLGNGTSLWNRRRRNGNTHRWWRWVIRWVQNFGFRFRCFGCSTGVCSQKKKRLSDRRLCMSTKIATASDSCNTEPSSTVGYCSFTWSNWCCHDGSCFLPRVSWQTSL